MNVLQNGLHAYRLASAPSAHCHMSAYCDKHDTRAKTKSSRGDCCISIVNMRGHMPNAESRPVKLRNFNSTSLHHDSDAFWHSRMRHNAGLAGSDAKRQSVLLA